MTDKEAAGWAKKLQDEGKETQKISQFLLAVENGEADIAGQVITELTEDPLAGLQISKKMKFAELIETITDQLEKGEFAISDISDWKHTLNKMKLPIKQQRTVDNCLSALSEILNVVDMLDEYESPGRSGISVPSDSVVMMLCPCIPPGAIYALCSECNNICSWNGG